MYHEKFVVCVKVNGKILREAKDIVFLPFGTEYSILLKNLNTDRAKVRVYIDGSDVMSGCSLILDGNSECELEGFVSTCGNVTNKFKFIEKTQQISDYRGDKPEDGLIRVVYSFEVFNFSKRCFYSSEPLNYRQDYKVYSSHKTGCPPPDQFYSNCNVSLKSNNASYSVNCCCEANSEGITVKGSSSNQSFNSASFGLSGEEHVIILKLYGTNKEVKIEKPITTKTKIKCETCGKRTTSKNKFCPNCGTALF